jgi:ribosome-associated toxin RatA of RatAB toxin-antitoxin module
MTARMSVIGLWLVGSALAAAQAPVDTTPLVSVRETDNRSYVVAARFTAPETVPVVRAVLTDYEQIPRFMPGVRTSRVLERADGRARLEQEAVSRFMMFSKRVHLVLDVAEEADAIRFRDVCGGSFQRYEGAWILIARTDSTEVEYMLTATPAFDVPGFVLRKILDRDAREMIDGLRTEIRASALARTDGTRPSH